MNSKVANQVFGSDRIGVSFEFFPARDETGGERLWQSIKKLEALNPDFVSVTYGAGGSTHDRSGRLLGRICRDTTLDAAAHLTCVSASKSEVNAVAAEFAGFGIRRFVALRGDPEDGIGSRYQAHPDGYANAAELVSGLMSKSDFDVSVSAYPEKHPESPDFATDIEMLKRKADAGAARAITQYFFDNDVYERYVERVRRAGIFIPIVPGILPINSFRQMASFSARCGATVPEWLAERFEGLDNDPQTHQLVSAAVAAEQVHDLIGRGVEDFHFYTMNRAELVVALCQMIGIRRDSVAKSDASTPVAA